MFYSTKKTDYESQIQILQYQKIKQEFEMSLIGLNHIIDQKQYEQFMKIFDGLDKMFSQLIQKQMNSDQERQKCYEQEMMQKYYREKVEELEGKLKYAQNEINEQRQIIKQIRKTVENNQKDDWIGKIKETVQKKETAKEGGLQIKKRLTEQLDQIGELLQKEQQKNTVKWDGRLKNVERLQMELYGEIRRKL